MTQEVDPVTKSFLVRMPDETFDALKTVSELDGTSMNQLAVSGIEKALSSYARRRSVEDIVDEARIKYADVLEKLKDM